MSKVVSDRSNSSRMPKRTNGSRICRRASARQHFAQGQPRDGIGRARLSGVQNAAHPSESARHGATLPRSGEMCHAHSTDHRGTKGMTVAETADALGVSTQTIYNYIYAGKLRARRPGDRYILRERDVANLVARRDDQHT